MRSQTDELELVPAKRVPVARTAGCLLATEVVLASGSTHVAVLGNLDPTNARLTEHFLTLSVMLPDGAWFHLARYHDIAAEQFGPAALAAALGQALDKIFPIRYDVRNLVRGASPCLVGEIHAEPRERLTREAIIGLAVP